MVKPAALRLTQRGIAVLLPLLVLAAACGNGDARERREYLEQLAFHMQDIRVLIDTAITVHPGFLTDPADTRQAYQEIAALYRDFAFNVSNLLPPLAVIDEHNEMIDATREAADALDRLADQIADDLTPDELKSVIDQHQADADAAFARVTSACLELQRFADGRQIEVLLPCQELS